MVNDYRLTTFDNPYNPFDQFALWLLYDVLNGYNTCGYLARIAKVSDNMSEADYNLEVERAIDEIIKYDPSDNYVKVRQKSQKM